MTRTTANLTNQSSPELEGAYVNTQLNTAHMSIHNSSQQPCAMDMMATHCTGRNSEAQTGYVTRSRSNS